MKHRYLYITIVLILSMTAPALGAENPPEAEIPWNKIPADKTAGVREIMNSYTIYRQVEDTFPLCTPATFDYIMDRFRITNVVMRQVSPELQRCVVTNLKEGSYSVDDQVRITGTVELLYKTKDFRLYFVQGRWRYWGDNYFNGTAVVSVAYLEVSQNPEKSMKTRLRAYMKLESSVLSALTKAIDTLLPVLVDRRVALMKFSIRAAGEKICGEPQYVYDLLLKEPDITDAERKEYQSTFLTLHKERSSP